MNVLPVIQRELSSQSRQAFTYWLRVAGAGAVLAMAVYFALSVGLRPNSGSELFSYLHGILHMLIWLLVPLLTADCISRERREGTLGLLFLTPLKARDIVVAKGTVHGFRALTLLLAVSPIAMLPALAGGVDGRQFLASLALNAGSICLALGAGLLGTTTSKSWVRSILVSYSVAGLLAVASWRVLMGLFTLALGQPAYMNPQRGFQLALALNPEFLSGMYYSRAGMAFPTAGSSAQMHQAVFHASAFLFLASVVCLMLIVLVAAQATARGWQERPPHAVGVWVQRRFCTPVIMLGLLKRWMRRTLERNPIGWLERRSWSGRLVIWGWLAVMISIYTLLLTEPNFLFRSLDSVHFMMGMALILSMAVNSSSSFRRERETRVLELLLVSPINEWQIILGRLRGLWAQFLPSLVLLLGGWAYLAFSLSRFSSSSSEILGIAVLFVATPVVGLYFSLVCRNLLAGLAWTVLVAIILPLNLLPLARVGLVLVYWHGGHPSGGLSLLNLMFHPALLQLLIASVLCASLHRRLVQRRFATDSS